MIVCGKSLGKPTFGCPFCSASTPEFSDGELYTLGDLVELNQVWFHFFISAAWEGQRRPSCTLRRTSPN